MGPQPSWVDDECTQVDCENHTNEDDAVDSFSGICFGEENSAVCINSVLPDDVLEWVLAHLPIATIIKAGCVCKKWNEMVQSGRFTQNLLRISSQKPWYFMFTCYKNPYGHVFDPILSKWYKFEIPFVEPSWDLVSSSGLVCFMDIDYRRKLYVCNPITGHCRKLEEPPGAEVPYYCTLAISLTKSSPSYIVTVLKSKQVPGEEIEWNVSINVYRSGNKKWVSPVNVTSQAWRGGCDSVICHGVLYFVVYLTRTLGYVRYGMLAYDLVSQCFNHDVDECVILAPCPVTCMRLINLEEELVMVGGIEKQSRLGVVKGIGIWVLRGKEWEMVARMPNKVFRGFGEFDDVFASSGYDKLIYIHSYSSPALLMFDMNSKEWMWSHRCPAIKKFPLQLFSGVCFDPRLDIVP